MNLTQKLSKADATIKNLEEEKELLEVMVDSMSQKIVDREQNNKTLANLIAELHLINLDKQKELGEFKRGSEGWMADCKQLTIEKDDLSKQIASCHAANAQQGETIKECDEKINQLQTDLNEAENSCERCPFKIGFSKQAIKIKKLEEEHKVITIGTVHKYFNKTRTEIKNNVEILEQEFKNHVQNSTHVSQVLLSCIHNIKQKVEK